MQQSTHALVMTLTMIGLSFSLQSASAAKPSNEVLPASTKFSFAIAHQQEYYDRMARTGLGKMLLDPALKPFLDDLPRQMRKEASGHPLSALRIDLGIESADLKELGEGEATWALVHPPGGAPSRVLIADVAGRKEQTDALLQKVATAMGDLNARNSTTDVKGTTVTAFDIPASAEAAARKLYHFQKDDQLVFSEDLALARVLLNNLASDATDTLADQAGYQEVVRQCQQRAGDEAPDAVLFLVPVDLSEALRQLSPKQDERAVDGLAIARKHNFDAISAVGSYIAVGRGALEFHLRIAVHAPQPWKNGMRICKFPNRGVTAPPWVRGDCNAFTMLNVDFAEFAKYVGPLFDDVYGQGEEGLYDDLKNTLREDPDGPQIDIDKELFGRLAPQVTLLARDALPVTPDSPQRLIALAATDESALAEVVRKALESDSSVEARKVAGRDAFFSYVEEDADAFGAPAARPQDQPPSFITCVARGHLMFATDVKILEDALTAPQSNSMADDADYQRLAPHLKSLGENICVQFFGRLHDALRVNYELFRQGKKPNGAKSFNGLLNNIALGEPPEVDPPQFDGSKLPPFDELQQDLGLAGLVGEATENGWFLEGFVLKKQDSP